MNFEGNLREFLRHPQPVRGLRLRRHDAFRLEAQERGTSKARTVHQGSAVFSRRTLQWMHKDLEDHKKGTGASARIDYVCRAADAALSQVYSDKVWRILTSLRAHCTTRMFPCHRKESDTTRAAFFRVFPHHTHKFKQTDGASTSSGSYGELSPGFEHNLSNS